MTLLATHFTDYVDSLPVADAHGYQPRQLVLMGNGMANVELLLHLATHPLAEMRITLVTPYPCAIYPGMLPGFVAGHYRLEECAIPLEPLVRHAGVRWLQRKVRALDANAQTLLLDDGNIQHYDWLSINTGAVQNRGQIEREIPGAREHGLFVHPLETFATLWPRVCTLGEARALRIAIVGAGTAAMELAMAVRQRLPQSAVTLVAGALADAANTPNPLQQRLTMTMKAQRITVLYDNAVGLTADEIQLGCGARLACDAPLLAIEGQTPHWLDDSALARTPQGRIATDSYQRSTSHPQIFAVTDNNSLALARNLPAAATGGSLQAPRSHAQGLHLLFGGAQRAVAGWGTYSAQGRPIGWLKEWTDRRFVARYLRSHA